MVNLLLTASHRSCYTRRQQLRYRRKDRHDNRIAKLAIGLGIRYRNTKMVSLRRFKSHQTRALAGSQPTRTPKLVLRIVKRLFA